MGEEGEQSTSTPVDAIAEATPVDSAPEVPNSAEASAPAPVAETQQSTEQTEPKPVSAVNPSNANLNINANSAVARSASQPGHQRFQQNGFHSRAQSPNAPFNGNGNGNGPRRAGRPFPNANANANGHPMQQQGVRSVSASAGARANKQRIPNADEFPALGGMSMSGNTSPQEKSSAVFGKTAAQVLSAPAPPKPEVVKQDVSEDVSNLYEVRNWSWWY
jgi:hypothetical protein